MHWTCVEARLRQQEVSGGLDCSVVFERHYPLNWLVNVYGDDWDRVRTDT